MRNTAPFTQSTSKLRLVPSFFERAQALGFEIPFLNQETLDQRFPGGEESARILDGKKVSENLIGQCQELVKTRRRPRLVVLLAGENPASHVYVANKERMFKAAGFDSQTIAVPAKECTQKGLENLVAGIGERHDVDGVLVQLPLPDGIDAARVLANIPPEKDVDGFLPVNMGSLATGQFEGALPCTPYGVMVMLAAYGIDVRGKKAVVVGRSNTVGKPMGLLLLSEDATVTFAHSRTKALSECTAQADILIAAAGKPLLVGREHVKPGAVVIDVGIHRRPDGKLCGDVDAQAVAAIASALTPVPGGVGPMTIAMLLVNTAVAAWSRCH
jgi:methylenetetrahydrofolate dehydrogenase (NADP+) / methenyltetrahydrofolate cyclohydrolase